MSYWRDLLFITRDFWKDGWTYGDWRQYIARRRDGALQPCRASGIPIFMMLFGGFGLFPALMGVVFTLQGIQPIWERIATITGISALVFATGLFLCLSPWTLMTAVGPRSYNGQRHF